MKATVTSFFTAFWIGCATLTSLLAQPEDYRFEHLTEQQGLSHNMVWSILQDREGFMWFGTLDGLNKYDGYTFTVLKPDPDDPENTLHHNIIVDIHEDREGRLWVNTFGGGFHLVDKHTGKVTRFEIRPLNTGFWNVLGSIYEDREGILWISAAGGVARFDPATQEFTLYPSPNNVMALSVTQDSVGRFWVASKGGVYQLDRRTGKYIPVLLDTSLAKQPVVWSLYLDQEDILWAGTQGEGLFRLDTHRSPLRFTRYNPGGLINKTFLWSVNGIYEDTRRFLWISTFEGLQRINKQTHEVFTFQYDPLKPGSLNHERVNIVYQDREGALWIGTDNGVNVAHPKKFRAYQIIPTLPSVRLQENQIGPLLEDHTGTIWLTNTQMTLERKLYRFDLKTGQAHHVPINRSTSDNLVGDQVWSIYEDQQNRLWMGSSEALYRFDRSSGQFIRYSTDIWVEHITKDEVGNLWIGGGGGIASFNPEVGKFRYYQHEPRGHIIDMIVSPKGDIWIAYLGEGLDCLNPQTGLSTPYLPDPTNPEGHINDKEVRTLYEDEEGILWIGTMLGGLNRFDPITDTFTYFTMQDGLPSNYIVGITGDENGNLWLGTNQGISRFNPKTKEFRNYDVSDGLPANHFQWGSVYHHNGKLMFGSDNGFVIFHPDSIQDNPTIPPVYITGFHVMEEERAVPTDQLELSYDNNFLSFDFVALNYVTPEKNQYVYMLEGLDKDWVYSGTRRYASYPDLNPGAYTFRVKASSNNGIWNEEGASIQFVILPPWWQTGWAYTLYGLLALGMLWSIRRYEIKRLRLRHRAQHLAEVDDLKSRFFANISHEFRTPLTLILGPLKDMYEGTFRGDRKAVFGVMIRNGQHLLNLINQLLDFSKLEAGKMQLQATHTDLVALLRYIASSYESIALEKKIKYFFYPEMQELRVYADQEKIEKIAHNLLSNAFKFTPQGGEVIMHLKTQEQQWALISVKDTGTGIPAEELDKVFDRFYQVDSSQTRTHEGTGLGMALAKELAELHHGRLTVESKEGKGTTFTVWLPLGKEHLSKEEIKDRGEAVLPERVPVDQLKDIEIAEVGEKETPVIETNNPLILVVEDNADMRHYIRNTLGDQYQVREAKNGRKGISIAQEWLPDLIISDIMMPEMDGFRLCERIKSHELTSHIPVILLTAKADRQSKLTGLETGADDYLAKPFDAQELQLIVRNRIEERRKMRERFGKEITLEPKQLSITSLDEKFLRKVLDIIEEHMADEDFTIEDLSKEAGYSQVQFYRKLKALSDQSPSQFLRTIRLKRAAAMLQQKSDTISQIAYGVGFNNLSYFNKCFKEQFGMTPGQYAAADQEVK